MSAENAERFGLVNQLVESEALDALVLQVASKFANKPADALRTSRRLMRARHSYYLDVIKREGEQFGRLIGQRQFRIETPRFAGSLAAGR